MCGIVGFVDGKTRFGSREMLRIGRAMADELQPRGPDDAGTVADEPAGLALGFRRLSIRDLSAAGHQPMQSGSGDSLIVFNGEIYNADELRPELEAAGCRFRGHSDTEVLLEACRLWGVEPTLERIVGMFAFAFYDKRTRRLAIARDRLGKKPIYYGVWSSCLIFASQPRAFFRHPLFVPEIAAPALSAFMQFGYVPNPLAIFRGMQQLPPGCLAYVSVHGEAVDVQVRRYWQAECVAAASMADPFTEDSEAIQGLEAVLRDAVGCRMVADVPLGAFLSGGMDSSLVVAFMQEQSSRPVRTFSIGFEEAPYNEAPYAAAVARHLATDHHEMYVSSRQALDLIPELPEHFDEPFADSSQIPTLIVSRMARRHVTVVLTGDGGDELFAGYLRYQRMAAGGPPHIGGQLTANAARLGQRLLRRSPLARAMLPMQFRAPAERWLARAAAHSGAMTLEGRYAGLVSPGFAQETVMPDERHAPAHWWTGALADTFPGTIERCQMIDSLTYLPDDILTKVDRASMASSLEARAPLLDHRVFELAWRLPMSMKVRGDRQKWILGEILHRRVPRALVERPKMGFGVPIDEWLRGPLRDWAEDLLRPQLLREEGYFDVDLVRGYWDRHCAGESWHYALWCVLMFQAWKRRWTSPASSLLPA